jgi:glutamine synthetase
MFGYSILRTSQNSEFYYDLFNLLTQFNIPIEGLHTETGPGVYEAAIAHDEVLAAADKAVLFKTAVKEIASKHGIMASFMAKWNENLPGCSGHIHQSLWTKDKTLKPILQWQDVNKMSDLHKHYLPVNCIACHTCYPCTPLPSTAINAWLKGPGRQPPLHGG